MEKTAHQINMPRPSAATALVALLTASAGLCCGAIGDLRVIGATATQAVVGYTAPDRNPCTIEVSENSSLSPLVHDTDPAIFADSGLDNRPGDLSSGQARLAVIGKRSAELATAGLYAGIRHFSRALQAYTHHFWAGRVRPGFGYVHVHYHEHPSGQYVRRSMAARCHPSRRPALAGIHRRPYAGVFHRSADWRPAATDRSARPKLGLLVQYAVWDRL